MKKIILLPLLLLTVAGFSQQVIGSVNTGAVNTNNLIYSVGEIFVAPVNANEANSGLTAVVSRISFFSTGINDKVTSDDYRAYPNPATNSVAIETSNPQPVTQVFIFDGNGKMVASPTVTAGKVDVSSLAKGIYFFKTNLSNNSSFKIVKQ